MIQSEFPLSNESHFCWVFKSDSLQSAINKHSRKIGKAFGFTVVLNLDSTLYGIMSEGDLLRALSEFPSSTQVKYCCNLDPIKILSEDFNKPNFFDYISNFPVRFFPVVDSIGKVLSVFDKNSLVNFSPYSDAVIIGLGFVGITLAAVLASNSVNVVGIDKDLEIVNSANQGQSHIFEPLLNEYLSNSLATGRFISYTSIPSCSFSRHFIVSVGTPLAGDQPNLTYVQEACENIAQHLAPLDLVTLRSTVPIGTTRNFCIPILENVSNLRAGIDFFVSFAPERTVEGNALRELVELPQIISGFSPICLRRAKDFWQQIIKNTVLVDSLEHAESVKLLNNSYRDYSFAFVNSLVPLLQSHNINVAKLIASANEGYPRNPIPQPSPGVGGYCLTKDPILLSSLMPKHTASYKLLAQARSINEASSDLPLYSLSSFLEAYAFEPPQKILVVGIAFKGSPSTNDIRFSSAVSTTTKLLDVGHIVTILDHVVHTSQIEALGLSSIDSSIVDYSDYRAILILNNHLLNPDPRILSSSFSSPTLLFDGWSQFSSNVGLPENLYYSTLGFNSF